MVHVRDDDVNANTTDDGAKLTVSVCCGPVWSGGGTKGMDSRRPKCSLQCKICKAAAPSLVIMQEHYAAKHPKIVMNAADYEVKEE